MTGLARFSLLLVAMAGCTPAAVAPRQAALPVPPMPELPAGLCRVGADGGIPVADRGIGGTGTPARPATRFADRGIGGTGMPLAGGIGGTGAVAARTGIVGVITGFASVCLAGEEVGYAPGLPVLVDGRPAGLDSLRAGQVAVVVAEGPVRTAASLAIRHEVSGPVERVDPDGSLVVAGQTVRPPPGPLPPGTVLTAPVPPALGRWVMVSGFRQANGVIVATRLDPRAPGEVLLRGVMRQVGERLYIGLAEIRPARFQERRAGIPVVAIGRLNDGVLEADTVEADGLLLDPPGFFGPGVGVLVLEGYAEGGVFRFGGGLRATAAFGDGRALARFQRGPAGDFAPGQARPSLGGGFGTAPRFEPEGRGRFEPAPLPNRGMDRGGRGEGPGRSTGPDGGAARRGAEGGDGGPGRRTDGGDAGPGGAGRGRSR